MRCSENAPNSRHSVALCQRLVTGFHDGHVVQPQRTYPGYAISRPLEFAIVKRLQRPIIC